MKRFFSDPEINLIKGMLQDLASTGYPLPTREQCVELHGMTAADAELFLASLGIDPPNKEMKAALHTARQSNTVVVKFTRCNPRCTYGKQIEPGKPRRCLRCHHEEVAP